MPKDHRYFFLEKPLLNEQDCILGVNVMPFDSCKLQKECKPELFPQWEGTQSDKWTENRLALIKSSFLGCRVGGCITIETDGQEIFENQKIEWNSLVAASIGANTPIDKSLWKAPIKTYIQDDSGNIPLSNDIALISDSIKTSGDLKQLNAEKTYKTIFDKNNPEFNLRSTKAKNKIFNARTGSTAQLNGFTQVGKKATNWGAKGNWAAVVVGPAVDCYNNYKDPKLKVVSTKCASEVITDTAIGVGSIKLTTGIGGMFAGPPGAVIGYGAGLVLNMALDGVYIGDITLRTFLQEQVKFALDWTKENWVGIDGLTD